MGKEMKAREDNRDVFEKVMDFAVPVAGGYLGMRGGRLLAGGGRKSLEEARAHYKRVIAERDKAYDNKNIDDYINRDWMGGELQNEIGRREVGRVLGGLTGVGLGSVGSDIVYKNVKAKKRRK